MSAHRNEALFIDDIVVSIERINAYLADESLEGFRVNVQKQDAVIRRIEIIGEATKHISAELKARYPDIPWQDMMGMRNIIVHEYFGISLDRVWEVCTMDIPELYHKIKKVQANLKD